MADFNESFDIVIKHEGLYSNHAKDKGGETFMGISRVYHPEWDGWEIVDNASFHENKGVLLNSVKYFYKTNYWNRFMGDQIPGWIVTGKHGIFP